MGRISRKRRCFPVAGVRRSLVFQAARRVCRLLQRNGFEAFFVGGAVRDFFLEPRRIPKDIDLATNALPEQVMELFPGSSYVGKEFGVVLVRSDGEGPGRPKRRLPGFQLPVFEVTTFRREGVYSNRRHPDSVEPGTREEDSRRRDFTWNALYFDPVRKKVWDPHGGLNDLAAHRIRAVGAPFDRFFEDALRILRLCRFSASFGMSVEPGTREAARRASDGLLPLSRERIVTEIRKVRAGRFLRFMTCVLHVVPLVHIDAQFLPLASCSWENRPLPNELVGCLQGDFHREFPLLSFTLAVVLASDDRLAWFRIVAASFASWPVTRAEARVFSALEAFLVEENLAGRRLEVAAHAFLEKLPELGVARVGALLSFAAHVKGESASPLVPLGARLARLSVWEVPFRPWWGDQCQQQLFRDHRKTLATEVARRSLSPKLIRTACALVEMPALRAAVGLEGSVVGTAADVVDEAVALESGS